MKRRLIYGVVQPSWGQFADRACVYLSAAPGGREGYAYPSLETLWLRMEKVRKDYVDGQKLKYQDLVYGALKGMINTLDPHSEFMEPEKYKELQNDTQGAFGGLGIVISMKDNFITVIAPMEDSPGFKAGIMSGRPHRQDRRQEHGEDEPAGCGQELARRAGHRSQDHGFSALLRQDEGLQAEPGGHQH